MQYNRYKLKFYLNASHAIYLNGVLGQPHPHTWEIVLATVKLQEDFVTFNDIETVVEDYLKPMQDRYLNDLPRFSALNPTLENLSRVFKDALQTLLYQNGWVLLTIEVSETPARAYLIDVSDEAPLPGGHNVPIGEAVQDKLDEIAKGSQG